MSAGIRPVGMVKARLEQVGASSFKSGTNHPLGHSVGFGYATMTPHMSVCHYTGRFDELRGIVTVEDLNLVTLS